MDNLSSICKLRNHLQAGRPKPRHIKSQTELHINNCSLQWPGQNLSHAQRKRLVSLEDLRRSIVRTFLRWALARFFQSPYSETWIDTCLTSFTKTPNTNKSIKHPYSTSLTKSEWGANRNYLFSQYEQPLLGQVNKL